MAAITTLDTFDGAEAPMSTGVTVFAGTGFNESGGVGSPASTAADQGMVWDTLYPEDENAEGTITKVEWEDTDGTPWEDGAEWRVIYDYIDSNNYRYVRVLWGNIATYDDLNDDEVQLWKVVGGTPSQLTPDTIQGKSSPSITRDKGSGAVSSTQGHLRHYELKNRSTTLYPAVTILTTKDQHIVRVTAKDPYPEARDMVDEIVLRATDTRNATCFTTGGKVGIWYENTGSGSVTIKVRSIQAQTVTVKWVATTGSDSAAGDYDAPWLTLGKLLDTLAVNQFGFVRSGSYTQTIAHGTTGGTVVTIASGTSWEDAPTWLTYSSDLVTWNNSGNGGNCLNIKGLISYLCFHGFVFDGNHGGNTTYAVRIWAQSVGGAGNVPTYIRFKDCWVKDAPGGAGVQVNQGTLYLVGTPPFTVPATSSEFDQYHEFIDVEASGAWDQSSSSAVAHGFYFEASRIKTEYCHLHDNVGNGGKNSFGDAPGTTVGGVQVCNNNTFRFNLVHDNSSYGWFMSGGDGGYMHHNESYGNGSGSTVNPVRTTTIGGSGLSVYSKTSNVEVYNNVAYRNGQTGGNYGNIAVESTSSNYDSFGHKVYNNTSYGGKKYGILFRTTGSATIGSGGALTVKGNVDYNNVVGSGLDEVQDGGTIDTGTPAGNHVDADGDPLFNGPGTSGQGDFTLEETSPLIDITAAYTSALGVFDDFYRRVRPQEVDLTGNDAWDIGAVEFPNPPTNPPTVVLEEAITATIDAVRNLALSVTDPEGDVTGTALNDGGVWVKTTGGTLSGTNSGTGVFDHA